MPANDEVEQRAVALAVDLVHQRINHQSATRMTIVEWVHRKLPVVADRSGSTRTIALTTLLIRLVGFAHAYFVWRVCSAAPRTT